MRIIFKILKLVCSLFISLKCNSLLINNLNFNYLNERFKYLASYYKIKQIFSIFFYDLFKGLHFSFLKR